LRRVNSTARRKGLTLFLSRRMKNTYLCCSELVETGKVDLDTLITHRFLLSQVPQACALKGKYQQEVVKILIEP
jgi:L-iditol 2-dehydrogenase